MDLFEKCRKESNADKMIKMGVYPYFRPMSSRSAPEVIMQGRRRIMLGSNNYLGLTEQPEVVEAAIKAIEKYGTDSSGSRFLNGTLDMHLQLEAEIAQFVHKDDALVFPTGYQTNLGVVGCIVGHGDYVISDKENHASIYDGCRLSYGTMLRYRHSDMQDLEAQLQKVPEESGCLIVTDGIFSMTGEICKLPEICALAKKYNAKVMVDDAHALGVIGVGGRGTASHFGLEDQVDLIMGTFSKSLASLGGYVAASADVIQYMRHESRPFIFSTAMSPASCAAALEALQYLKAHPELVQQLSGISHYTRQAFRRRGLTIMKSSTPIVPIYTYEMINTIVKGHMAYENGVYINPVLPPACPEGEGLLRASCMATLTKDLIDEAADILADVILNDD